MTLLVDGSTIRHLCRSSSTRQPDPMTPELTMIIAVIAGVVLAIAGGVIWWMNRTPRVQRNESGILPLFGGLSPSSQDHANDGVMAGGVVRQTPATAMRAVAPTPAPPPVVAVAPAPVSTVEPERSRPIIREFVTKPMPAPVVTKPASARADAPVVSATGVPGTMVEGHLLRFSVPAEGTLQFLPGRLEIASGIDTGREIRFVRVPGPNGLEVTFGRSEGELYKHIQLRDQTVSRSHARLRLEEGRWHLFNYSQTNPVVHNGQLLGNDAEQPLDDGDRIEMGEVLFTFRSR